MSVRVIIGLGNPGKRYKRTRHNVGFVILDELAQDLGCEITRAKFECLWTSILYREKTVFFVKPQTFMNRSGHGVKPFLDFFEIQAPEILVVHDDLDLPLGRLKLAKRGKSGGHKGVKSIIDTLGTQDFNRLKIGIGRPRRGEEIEDFVLSPFYQEDLEVVSTVLESARRALKMVLEKGVESAMNEINRST